ncbi:MAG: TlpA family protein disulfide reductase [Pseudomarimonas sp.]
MIQRQPFRLRLLQTAVAGFFALLLSAPTIAATPQVGSLPPAFAGLDADHKPVRFDPTTLEKPALIFFWATWCGFCKALMPPLQALIEEVGAHKLDVYAVDMMEPADADPVAVLTQLSPSMTLVRDGDAIGKQYGVMGTPKLYLVGSDGKLLYARPDGASAESVRASVLALLAAPAK